MNKYKYINARIAFVILAGLLAAPTFVNLQGLMNGK